MRLIVVPSAPILFESDCVIMDRKMFDGIFLMKNLWNDDLVVYASQADLKSFNFDTRKIFTAQTDIQFISSDVCAIENIIKENDVFLFAADDYRQLDYYRREELSSCRIFYCLEYTLRTRIQILFSERRRIKSYIGGLIFFIRTEVRRVSALKHSVGLQFNGYPAFLKYKKYQTNSVLYLDTRINQNDIPSEASFEISVDRVKTANKLRITYSGRLTRMKGSHFLVKLASELHRREIDFELNIYGSGDLFQYLGRDAQDNLLQRCVKLHGSVDFRTVLMPEIQFNTDVFFAPHIQGDPSCTYLETLSLGVPILGFTNEAWKCLYEATDGHVGWLTGVGAIEECVKILMELSRDRSLIVAKKRTAFNFAKHITFESQFKKRIQQLKGVRPDGAHKLAVD